jgi:hypothetical protein
MPQAERFAFVRDGFSFWAFLLAPLWMLRHRMWLVLASYVGIMAVVETIIIALGASRTSVAFVAFLISLLVGLEAGTLRRITLTRRGWKNVGVVSGDDVEDAEWRFFDTWIKTAPSPSSVTGPDMPSAGAPTVTPRAAETPDVIGLFPDSGAAT